MKSVVERILVFVAALLVALPALATTPVRPPSRNGENSNAQDWVLFGPTEIVTLTRGTTKVQYKQQVVCPNQQVTNAIDPLNTNESGACEDGAYLFIFQLRSTSTNVHVQLSGLLGFTPDANEPTYGVILCDPSPSQNTLELCTTATQDQLPAITFSTNTGNTTATFGIPNVPNFVKGTNHQGYGVTIFVMTQQIHPHPISLPKISLQ
jgi:hypothetical protein